MAYFMKNIVIPTSLSCFFLLFSHSTWSETNISRTKQRIIDQRNYWLDEIKNGVITTSPQKGSRTAELDRIISNKPLPANVENLPKRINHSLILMC